MLTRTTMAKKAHHNQLLPPRARAWSASDTRMKCLPLTWLFLWGQIRQAMDGRISIRTVVCVPGVTGARAAGGVHERGRGESRRREPPRVSKDACCRRVERDTLSSKATVHFVLSEKKQLQQKRKKQLFLQQTDIPLRM